MELRNAGPELVVYGRNKALAFESSPVLIPTGVILAMKPGQVACVKATTDLVTSDLFLREVAFEHSYSGEVFISVMNLGESDIVIPPGAIMPARLFCFSCRKNFKIISDLEYLKEKADPGSQDV